MSIPEFDVGTKPWENPVGILGLEFIEFVSPTGGEALQRIFESFGLTLVAKHRRKNVLLYQQNDIHFILNCEKRGFFERFSKDHGPSAPAIGLRVKNSAEAVKAAVARGAKEFKDHDLGPMELSIPAVYGVGDSLVYLIDRKGTDPVSIYDIDFERVTPTKTVNENIGLLYIDHLTNNVKKGQMDTWAKFYGDIFGFKQIRYFDIQGPLKTGLHSRAMLSPCKRFAIPINEPTDVKSQIQEYLSEYRGEGIQHIALCTENIIKTVDELKKLGIEFLVTPGSYFDMLKGRCPYITEDVKTLRELGILVDGDEKGYLLQIFTKNLIGPIFMEIIQRKGHWGFGEGNFQALFDSMERDQQARGVL